MTDDQEQYACSDLNTTALLNRMLDEEEPDLVVFTGIESVIDSNIA